MPRRLALSLLLSIALTVGAGAQEPRKPESLLTKLLRIAGFGSLPARMRAPDGTIAAGDVWIVDLDSQGPPRPLTSGGGYRSPIVLADRAALLALHGDAIVRIQTNGGASEQVLVSAVNGVRKLVGVDVANPSEVVVLLEDPLHGSPLAAVSFDTGKTMPLPFDPTSSEERQMITQMRGEYREYSESIVLTKIETKRGVSRVLEWHDVFLKRGNAEPENVTRCDGANCTQPSLSPDGRLLAFIRS